MRRILPSSESRFWARFSGSRPRRRRPFRCRAGRPGRTGAGPVVVRVWVRHGQHRPPRRLVGTVRAAARAPELLHALVTAAVGEVDVEATAGRIVRGKCHREEALLAPRGDLGREVQERTADPLAAEQQHDPPALLHDEDPPPVAGGCGHVEGVAEGADALQPYSAGRRFAASPVPPGSASRSVGVGGHAALELVLADLQAHDQRAHQQQMEFRAAAGTSGCACGLVPGTPGSPGLLAEPVLARAMRTGRCRWSRLYPRPDVHLRAPPPAPPAAGRRSRAAGPGRAPRSRPS